MAEATIHLFLFRRLKRLAKGRTFIAHHTMMEIMKRYLYHVPRVLHYPIIKDMEKDKLIKKIDRTKYELTGGKADNQLNKFNCPI